MVRWLNQVDGNATPSSSEDEDVEFVLPEEGRNSKFSSNNVYFNNLIRVGR